MICEEKLPVRLPASQLCRTLKTFAM